MHGVVVRGDVHHRARARGPVVFPLVAVAVVLRVVLGDGKQKAWVVCRVGCLVVVLRLLHALLVRQPQVVAAVLAPAPEHEYADGGADEDEHQHHRAHEVQHRAGIPAAPAGRAPACIPACALGRPRLRRAGARRGVRRSGGGGGGPRVHDRIGVGDLVAAAPAAPAGAIGAHTGAGVGCVGGV